MEEMNDLRKNVKLNKLREEYNKFNLCGSVVCKDDVEQMIFKQYGEISATSDDLQKQQRKNVRNRKISSVLVNIPFIRVHKTPNFYAGDSGDIILEKRMCADYLGYYNRIYSELTTDNYEEIGKLVGFCTQTFDFDFWAIENNRARREGACYGTDEVKGYSLRYKDTLESLIDETLGALSVENAVEKAKK